MLEHSTVVCVKSAPGKGRGVFATGAIKAGDVIEKVPVLIVPIESLVNGLKSPVLSSFFYLWNKKQVAISLGYGSLYNHSYKPNAEYEHGRQAIIYRALRDIEPGEEITVNYNGDPNDRASVGFDVV